VLDDSGDDTVAAPIYEVAPDIAAVADLAAVGLGTSVVARAGCESSRRYLVYGHRFPSRIRSLHCFPAYYSFPQPVYHPVRTPQLTDSSYMGLGRVEHRHACRRNLSLDAVEKVLVTNPMAKRQLDDRRVLMQSNPLYCSTTGRCRETMLLILAYVLKDYDVGGE